MATKSKIQTEIADDADKLKAAGSAHKARRGEALAQALEVYADAEEEIRQIDRRLAVISATKSIHVEFTDTNYAKAMFDGDTSTAFGQLLAESIKTVLRTRRHDIQTTLDALWVEIGEAYKNA